MAMLRRARVLRCFYCNERTGLRYDGQMRQFACPKCEATNYLDESGAIADVPAAAVQTDRDPDRDPLSLSMSPGSTTTSERASVFCSRCLQNQHLFVASLAQYFPAEPEGGPTAEDDELERQYFRFRRGLEQRYPQICADCEPRVLARIRAADYTAKTDHLRRMVQYSRDVRVTRTTGLDIAHTAGRAQWWAALAMQLLWQASVVAKSEAKAEAEAEDRLVQRVLGLPWAPLCLAATLGSCWWNPFLVETVRGFTRPLNGLATWYTFQAVLVVVRFALYRLGPERGPALLGAHTAAALFTLYIYAAAPRCITKDLRPLFGKTPRLQTVAMAPSNEEMDNRRRGLQVLSDVLDEISAVPSSTHRRHDSELEGWDGWQPAQTTLSETRQTSVYDEMDWTPTQPTPATPSPHRAFAPALGEPLSRQDRLHPASWATPVAASKGPFWYRVPPAPTSMAQRLFKPSPASAANSASSASSAFQKPVDPAVSVFAPHKTPHKTVALGPHTSTAGVEFAPPSFFAEDLARTQRRRPSADDPDHVLSDLFSQTFSLHTESESASNDGRQRPTTTPTTTTTTTTTTPATTTERRARLVRRLPAILLTVASLAGLSLIRDASTHPGEAGEAGGTSMGSVDRLVLGLVQPHARLAETVAVALCTLLAASRVRASLRGPSKLVGLVGLVLGATALLLAAWMVAPLLLQVAFRDTDTDTDTLDDDGWTQDAPVYATPADAALLQWPWWQLASLHGLVLAHEAWHLVL